jgi:LmbE family N-acetylglucosaminyl deacetylase
MGGRARADRLLVVVAHPDDETFGCGSLLLHAAARAETAVCCATRGEAGQPASGSGVRPGELGDVREVELRQAARVLGVTHVDLLGFADSGMAGPAAPGTLIDVPFDVVRDSVRERLETLQPDVVVTLDGSDGHRDHVRIRDATLAAVEGAAWHVERVYLHCLPRTLMRRWLEHVAREHPNSEHLTGEVPGTPDELITTVIDTTRQLPVREQAMACHASQLSPYGGLPEDLRLAFLTSERLRRVRPVWRGGERERDVFGSTGG